MANRLLDYVKKAAFTTSDISGGGNGGYLNTAQARSFLKDAIEPTAILSKADVFDSESHTFEVPKLSFSSRVMHAGVEGETGTQSKPDSGLVTLTTRLFKGEIEITEETFEDNVERDGLADSLASLIAEAVGRDLEEYAIKSDADDPDASFSLLGNGLVQSLVGTGSAESAAAVATWKELFHLMVTSLPSRYRRVWDRLQFFVPIKVADGYADEMGDRATELGDTALENRRQLRYRGIPINEVALMSGTQNGVVYDDFAVLCDPKNLKVGFWRRVRIRRHEEPRPGLHYFLPRVRYDVEWAEPDAVVLATGIPDDPA